MVSVWKLSFFSFNSSDRLSLSKPRPKWIPSILKQLFKDFIRIHPHAVIKNFYIPASFTAATNCDTSGSAWGTSDGNNITFLPKTTLRYVELTAR